MEFQNKTCCLDLFGCRRIIGDNVLVKNSRGTPIYVRCIPTSVDIKVVGLFKGHSWFCRNQADLVGFG